MLTIGQYLRPQTLEEAYTLSQNKRNVVIGGMLWLKMQNRSVEAAIDLCDLGLDTIEETEQEFRIGAMVSLHQMETHPGLQALTQGAIADSVKQIVGVQFRNLATVGGSLYGKFGFSDVLTMLMVLDAKVELYHDGTMSLPDFVNRRSQRDILVRVILPKTPVRTVYLSQRNTATDFPVLTCALAQREQDLVCAIGARPQRAMLFRDEAGILSSGITEERAKAFGQDIAERASFGANLRASAAYRKAICPVLVRRGLMALKEGC